MIMVFFMAVLSLDFLPYIITNTYNGQRQTKGNYSLYKSSTENEKSLYNITIQRSTPVTKKNETQSVYDNVHRFRIKPKVPIHRQHTELLKNKDNLQLNSIQSIETKEISPKSDTQVLQFYTQPINAYDLNYQRSSNMYHYDPLADYNPLPPPHLSLIPTVNPIAFKSLPQQFPKWNIITGTTGQPLLKPIPIYDPFNLYKRKPIFKYKIKKVPQQSFLQKIIGDVKPFTGNDVTTVAPVSITHVYKYEESNSGLKLPIDNEDDPILPLITVAINEHLDDRVSGAGLNNHMIPPKLNQPIYYNIPTILTLPTLSPPYGNEFQIINKFNDGLKTTQNTNLQHSNETPAMIEYEEEKDEKEYSDEDLKKALKYIQSLKKNKTRSRGSKKYQNSSDENESEKNLEKRKKKKKEKEEKEFLSEEIDDIENQDEEDTEFKRRKRRRNKKNKYSIGKNENYRHPTKTKNDDNIRYEETQIIPTVEQQHNAQSYPDFSQNVSLGDENEGNERVEFQMHGLQGPESYKFGYDTGKGENRQFRYEERDPDGRVKGHFGYYDKDGKLQVFHYEADPEHGYHLQTGSDN